MEDPETTRLRLIDASRPSAAASSGVRVRGGAERRAHYSNLNRSLITPLLQVWARACIAK